MLRVIKSLSFYSKLVICRNKRERIISFEVGVKMYPYLNTFGHLIPVYGIMMVIGASVSSIYAYKRALNLRCISDENDFIIITVASFGVGLLFAKIMYLLASYGIMKVLHEMLQGNFSAWVQDGLVYYGGLFGGIGTATWLAKRFNLNMALFCEAAVPCVPLGHMFGRIGCGCAGCCYGILYNGIGAIRIITVDGSALVSLFPVQFLEAFLNLLLFIGLVLYTNKFHTGFRTLILYLVPYGVIRFFLEFLRGDIIRGTFLSLSTAQWTSIALLLLIACSEFVLIAKKRNHMSDQYSHKS